MSFLFTISLNANEEQKSDGGRIHLHIFVEVDRLVVNIVLHEKIINAGQQGHLRQGENVHELFHALAVGTLKRTFIVCVIRICGCTNKQVQCQRCRCESPCHRSHSWSPEECDNLRTWLWPPRQKLDEGPCNRDTHLWALFYTISSFVVCSGQREWYRWENFTKKKSIWLELLWFFRPVGVGFELLEQILVSLTAVVANLFQFFFFF